MVHVWRFHLVVPFLSSVSSELASTFKTRNTATTRKSRLNDCRRIQCLWAGPPASFVGTVRSTCFVIVQQRVKHGQSFGGFEESWSFRSLESGCTPQIRKCMTAVRRSSYLRPQTSDLRPHRPVGNTVYSDSKNRQLTRSDWE